MREINAKEAVMDDMTDQISDNLEYLQMTAEMIGEEIDAQQELVEEVCALSSSCGVSCPVSWCLSGGGTLFHHFCPRPSPTWQRVLPCLALP